jgi:hemerythrin-like domain-containing protein
VAGVTARPSAMKALSILRQEHSALTAVLHGLQFLAGQIERGEKCDIRVLRAMLFYIDSFPDRFHHPKEDGYLFPTIQKRTGAADAVIAKLEDEHHQGMLAIRVVEQRLLHYEEGGAAYAVPLVQSLRDYIEAYRRHIRTEEEVLLPIAEQVLLPEDWRELGEVFSGHLDPLLGLDARQGFDRLFTHIVNIAPPPLGVGPEA